MCPLMDFKLLRLSSHIGQTHHFHHGVVPVQGRDQLELVAVGKNLLESLPCNSNVLPISCSSFFFYPLSSSQSACSAWKWKPLFSLFATSYLSCDTRVFNPLWSSCTPRIVSKSLAGALSWEEGVACMMNAFSIFEVLGPDSCYPEFGSEQPHKCKWSCTLANLSERISLTSFLKVLQNVK
ncbi:hypothetical protein Tco_0273760 [Tanacetum coccineum]